MNINLKEFFLFFSKFCIDDCTWISSILTVVSFYTEIKGKLSFWKWASKTNFFFFFFFLGKKIENTPPICDVLFLEMWKHTAECKMNIKIDLRNCLFDMKFVITKKWLNPMVNSRVATFGTWYQWTNWLIHQIIRRNGKSNQKKIEFTDSNIQLALNNPLLRGNIEFEILKVKM